METSRDDVGIAFRSALLVRGSKQKFSLYILVIFSIILIFIETLEIKPLNNLKSFLKDIIYRGSQIASAPTNVVGGFSDSIKNHLNLYSNYSELKKENDELKNKISKKDFLKLENTQLRRLIDEQAEPITNLVSARVMLDKQSPYLNSFVINIGKNKNVKNGLAVLDGKNFIGRTIDVNFFSSRVLLITDLNSKIPVLIQSTGNHAIISGHGRNLPTLEYLPEKSEVKDGDKVYTSGKEGIFSPGIPIGEIKIENQIKKVLLFSDLSQITFINIKLKDESKTK